MGPPVYSARHSFFHNSSTGVLVGENQLSGNGFILTTNDGGVNWTGGAPHVERLEGVYFANVSTGYYCGRNDYVVRTLDAGATWNNFDANTGDHLMDVFFTNPGNGFVVGRGGVIAHTADSAVNWTNQNSGTGEDLEGVWFNNDTTGWAVGTAGVIITTIDGGINWTAQTSNTAEDLFDIEFVNDSTGWAVGKAGEVLITLDAGITWTPEASGTIEDIIGISMISETLGWFCAKNGVIHIYSFSPPNSLNENQMALNVEVYPNPFTNSTTINFKEESGSNNYEINLIGTNGNVIRSWDIHNQSKLTIYADGIDSGCYFLKIVGDDKSSVTKKLIIR
jgi:photosystem II stability/assembly factor-like uncharacterized protein